MDVISDEAAQPCITPKGVQLTASGDPIHVSGTLAVPRQVNELVVTSTLIGCCLDCKLAARLSELHSLAAVANGNIRIVDVKIGGSACECGYAMCEEEIAETEALELPKPPTPCLSAEEESQARLIFECFDSDGSGCINVNEFAALIVKDRKVADFLGFRNGTRRSSNVAYRRSTNSIESTFRDMCGIDTTELTWPAFRDFVAGRSTLEVDSDGDGEPLKNKVLLPEDAQARLIFDAIDADASGKISCAELAAACIKRPYISKFVAGSNGGNGSRRPSADKVFKQMDIDGDLSISFEEFAQFIALQGEAHQPVL